MIPSRMKLIPRVSFALAIALAVSVCSQQAGAQTTSTPTTQTQQIDLNSLLQSLGGVGGLSGLTGLLGNSGTTTGGTTTGGTTTGGTTTGGTTTGGTTTGGTTTATTAPTIIKNQFNTTSSQALRQRSPGLFTRQAIALQDGSTTLPGTPAPVEPNFLRDTAQAVGEAVLTQIKNLLAAVNTGLGAIGGITTTPGTSGTTIANPATTGAGTTTPIQ